VRRFVLSSAARTDLLQIQDYIAQDNVAAAATVIDAIFAAFDTISDHPLMGHRREDLTNRDVRFWAVFSYLIIYDANTKPLSVVRVLSGYRDIISLLS
jgi:plasmid stabilization system protein ParE